MVWRFEHHLSGVWMSRDTCSIIIGTTIDFEFVKSLSLSQWHLDQVHNDWTKHMMLWLT